MLHVDWTGQLVHPMEQGVGYDLTDGNLREVGYLNLPAAGKTDGSGMATDPHLFNSPLVNQDEWFLHSLD